MRPLLSGAIDAIAAMAMAMVSSGILNSSETGDTWHKNWWQKTEENGKEQKTRCCYFPVDTMLIGRSGTVTRCKIGMLVRIFTGGFKDFC